jgi:hypothetical protein
MARWKRPKEVEAVLARLRAADEERRAAITDLVALGWIRTRGVVGELGERLAQGHYGGELMPTSFRGYDLVTPGDPPQRVEVRTLQMTPENNRTSMGVQKGGYDLLLGAWKATSECGASLRASSCVPGTRQAAGVCRISLARAEKLDNPELVHHSLGQRLRPKRVTAMALQTMRIAAHQSRLSTTQ